MEVTKLGKYEIRATIGRGAVGVVYQAWDPLMARTVAIKALPLLDLDDEGKEQYARFKREAQAAARLHHPNIVSAFDYGETDTSAYIVMEFLSGPSLKSMLARRDPLPLDRIGTIMHGLLSGLQHSHGRGVVHRDIKPANIVFSGEGEVKITDFGIAHLDTSGMTRAGSVLGTPAYMAPEQVLGDPVDARTDLFSTGVVLYEMLTGRRPFEGSTSSIMHKIVHLHPPQPLQLAATVSAAIDAVIAKALAKNPDERYQSAAEFDAALSSELARTREAVPAVPPMGEPESTVQVHRSSPVTARQAEPLLTRATPTPARTSSVGGRGHWRLLLGGTGAVALAAIAWLTLTPNDRQQEPAPPAVHAGGKTGSAEMAASTGSSPATLPLTTTPHPQVAPAIPPATQTAAAPQSAGAGAAPSLEAAAQPPETHPPAAADASAPPAQHDADPLQPLREQVQAIASSAPCSLITAEIAAADKVNLRGVSALGEASELEIQASLQRAIRAADPEVTTTWSMQRIDGPYCPVLDVLRSLPHGATGFGVALSLPGDRRQLTAGDAIPIAVATRSHPAQLSLDLFTGDGQVHHLHTGPLDQANPETAVMLRPGKPYGAQLLSVVIASAGWSDKARPIQESATAYLKTLQSALTHAGTQNLKLGADVLPIFITER